LIALLVLVLANFQKNTKAGPTHGKNFVSVSKSQ